eukprot:CAMPEP_0194153596 /NCGR_PEP_ID=MMETSP0152-20130528/56984_1 /TAXON_ID=1049557 /ORGANISM="Thalassiothrix antarctica, Strain L6-D1" /LENGTH=479 /DNA_ID=CAMNT_0038858993 /DNA_START=43 /DNA_END=1479 /DNA_ORIENTATION=-
MASLGGDLLYHEPTEEKHRDNGTQSSLSVLQRVETKEDAVNCDCNAALGLNEIDENETDSCKKQSSVFGASINLVNSIVGAGIIGIPYAFRQTGLVSGVMLLGVVGYMTDKSLRLILDVAYFHHRLKPQKVTNFEDLMSYPFGNSGSLFVLINMLILAYGAMVSYLLIIKDTVPNVLGFDSDDGYHREVILIATSLIIILPLALRRDMASLAFTSLISVAADIILVFFVAFCSPVSESIASNGGLWNTLQKSVFKETIFIGLGVLSLAMSCQHCAFIVGGSLANISQLRWATVTFRSIGIATSLSGLMGVSGYLGFQDETEGDVLNNFEDDSVKADTARALLAFTMFFTYPMESFVMRHVIARIVYQKEEDMNDETHKLLGGLIIRRHFWTLVIYILTLIPALLVDDIGPVLSITGSVGGSCVAYIGPGLAYLGVNGDAFLVWAQGLLLPNNELVEKNYYRNSPKEQEDITNDYDENRW